MFPLFTPCSLSLHYVPSLYTMFPLFTPCSLSLHHVPSLYTMFPLFTPCSLSYTMFPLFTPCSLSLHHVPSGLLPFYDALKARLLKVRAAMKPTSRLLLYDLHWIFHRRCLAKGGPHKMCFKCNNPQRVRAYRAALRLAAACTGTEFFSTAEVYKQMPAHTNDGIHYDRSLWTMESNVLLNGLCMRDGAPPMRFNNPVTCVGEAKGGEEAAQLQRWQAELSPDVLGCDCLLANQMQNSTVKSSKVR